MSETAPTSEAPKTADQAKVDKIEAQLKRAKFEQTQNELFGKNDTFIGPLNRGVDSHESYHAKRPHDGIYRDSTLGSSFRNAATGEASNVDAYNAQNGMTRENASVKSKDNPNAESWTYQEDEASSAMRYYDNLIGGDKPNEMLEPVNYDSMSFHELALSAVKAVELGDRDEVKDIREALDVRLLEEVTRPGTDKTEQYYHDELDRFDKLVELSVKDRGNVDVNFMNSAAVPGEPAGGETFPAGSEGASKTEATTGTEAAAGGSKTETAAGADSGTEAGTLAEPGEAPETGEGAAKGAEGEKPPRTEFKIGDFIEVNGQKVQVSEVLRGADGYIAYEIINALNVRELVFNEDVKPFVEQEEKKSFRERSKEWWENGKAKELKSKFTFAYVGYLWGQAMEGIANATINRGVNPNDLPAEQEKARSRNRWKLIAGVLAVAIASRLLSTEIHVAEAMRGVSLGGSDGAGGGLPGEEVYNGHLGLGGEQASQQEQDMIDSMQGGGETDSVETPANTVDQELPTPEALPVPDANFNVPKDEGGLALFENLKIDTDKWGDNAERLLSEHPEDFYRMEDGSVGISHEGWLSEATQADLNKLK